MAAAEGQSSHSHPPKYVSSMARDKSRQFPPEKSNQCADPEVPTNRRISLNGTHHRAGETKAAAGAESQAEAEADTEADTEAEAETAPETRQRKRSRQRENRGRGRGRAALRGPFNAPRNSSTAAA